MNQDDKLTDGPEKKMFNSANEGVFPRLAISGTYSTGKTTTSLALSYLTGIPRTHARTMREILPDALPGKALEDCSPAELIQLGIRRYTERAVHENHLPDGFISDGSSLHEWVYGKARMIVGINPNDPAIVHVIKNLIIFPVKGIYSEIIENIGSIVKQHAKRTYSEFIHLPVEFPLVEDGHRPVSERFRRLSDELLLETLRNLEIPYHVVAGSIEERLEKILEIYNFTPVMSTQNAIALAIEDVRVLHEDVKADALARKQQMETQAWSKSLVEKLRF